MCRSKAEGGRRCPGGTAAVAAPPRHTVSQPGPSRAPGRRSTSRAEARARWAQAERGLEAAKAMLGQGLGNPSYLLLGPLSHQAEHVRSGGDPSAYADQVAEGRAMLISQMVSHGDDPGVAAAKAESLATAYATWSATPEA